MTEPKRPNSLVFNEALLKGFINGTLEPAVEEKVAYLLESRPDLLEKISAKSGDGFLKRLREVQQRSSEKSPVHVKAEIVEAVAVNKASAKSETSIPVALANYAGYKIIKELGRGGMGVVYLAKNIQMDRLEVLKVLNERLLDHEGAKERFLREIRAVSKLSHMNIVTSYSILPLDNLLVFAMEYVHGIDLHQYTHKYKPLSVGLACSFAKQIAAGLQHAHEKGLVHRDIKPSNVIVYKSDGQLQLKILDFGLAKATREEAAKGAGLTQDGTMLGTPEYMSPEQTLNAAKADIRADIYSLGCTLYYMLTGKPPFTGTHGAVLLAHAQREPTALNLVRPEIPAELAAVVGKMLAKDLRNRYQTPSEVAKALLPFVNQMRPAASQSTGEAATSNTVNDLKSPERETSVEAPLSELSLDAASHASEPQLNIAAIPVSLQVSRPALHMQRSKVRTKTKARRPKWFVPAIIALGGLISFGAVWQIAALTFRTPNGTIVVENLPADAEVLVDGQKVEIAWNAGKDKAEVSIDAGSHQLRVLNQGNEIFGDKVSVKGGDSTIVKLNVEKLIVPKSGEIVQQPARTSDAHSSSNSALAALAPNIPRDVWKYNEKYYKVISEELTWHQARDECKKLGGRLAEVYNEAENDYLRALVKKVSTVKEVWLGATDEVREGEWIWGTGKKMDFNAWAKNQPNNKGNGENFLILILEYPQNTAFVGRWSDQPDRAQPTHHPGFICEWDAASTKEAGAVGKPSEDWQSLFNGTDLTGWKGDTSLWSVRDGCVTGKLTANDKLKANTCLIWDGGELGDFEIEYECSVSSEGNSGLQLRSKIIDANQFVLSGYQADIDGKASKTGILYEERGRAILANQGESVTFSPAGLKSIKTIGDSAKLKFGISGQGWNYYRVVAKGNKIQYYVNSQLTSEIVDQDATEAAATGVLGLQLHMGKAMQVQFKSIRLKHTQPNRVREGTPLQTDLPIDVNTPPSKDEVQSFFNGKDLAGWKGQPGLWSVEDGKIIGTTAPNGVSQPTYLVSTTTVRNFEVEFEVKLIGKSADTGFMFRSSLIAPGSFEIAGPQLNLADNLWCDFAIQGSLNKAYKGMSLKKADKIRVNKLVKHDDFNRVVLRCVDTRVIADFNGFRIIDEVFPAMPSSGVIAFQLWPGGPYSIQIANLKLTNLD